MTLNKNPLFPDSGDTDDKPAENADGYVVPRKGNRIEPLHDDLALANTASKPAAGQGANPAADLIRDKVARLYAEEPNAKQEEAESERVVPRSPHQQFMYQLSTSGKSLAEIQTEWHNYYVSLPDDQKHAVWQEFYENNRSADFTPKTPEPEDKPKPKKSKADDNGIVVADHTPAEDKPAAPATKQEARQQIRRKVAHHAKQMSTQHKQNFHSLLFGLITASVVLLVFMFGFFNQIIITPFIQPGKAAATPIIVDNASLAASNTPEVIIPKINVEIPVVYNVASNDENVIENALMDGVVHYPTTVLPGQTGNSAFFGHSSNNIFNKGKYKFAFVLLHTLKTGDTFYLTYNHKVYVYKVISRRIVEPTEVSVLNDVPGQTATATLITCDPPGTSLHRLVVVGKQISPDPTGNSQGTNTSGVGGTASTAQLASNGPTLWSRFWHWLF
jgi:sortase A